MGLGHEDFFFVELERDSPLITQVYERSTFIGLRYIDNWSLIGYDAGKVTLSLSD